MTGMATAGETQRGREQRLAETLHGIRQHEQGRVEQTSYNNTRHGRAALPGLRRVPQVLLWRRATQLGAAAAHQWFCWKCTVRRSALPQRSVGVKPSLPHGRQRPRPPPAPATLAPPPRRPVQRTSWAIAAGPTKHPRVHDPVHTPVGPIPVGRRGALPHTELWPAEESEAAPRRWRASSSSITKR